MSVLLDFINAEAQGAAPAFPTLPPATPMNVHVKIREGNKERIQQFQGVVLQRRNPSCKRRNLHRAQDFQPDRHRADFSRCFRPTSTRLR
ncbi:MAG: 50S ribosomal protein L19 [Hymenobacter sp.]